MKPEPSFIIKKLNYFSEWYRNTIWSDVREILSGLEIWSLHNIMIVLIRKFFSAQVVREFVLELQICRTEGLLWMEKLSFSSWTK